MSVTDGNVCQHMEDRMEDRIGAPEVTVALTSRESWETVTLHLV